MRITGVAMGVAILASVSGQAFAGATAPGYLRCEYLVNPLAVGSPRPRLSWEVKDARRGARQSAYQIQVSSKSDSLRSGKVDLWDSGRVAGAATAQVEYEGRELRSRQECWWRVRTYDGQGKASPWSTPACWRMGLLNRSDWSAHWIRDAKVAPAVARAHNGYHSALASSADTVKWVQIDLGTVRPIGGIRLWPTRPFDWHEDVPGFLFPLRYRIEISDDEAMRGAGIVVDRTGEDVPSPGKEPVIARFPETRGRYIRLTVTRLRERDAGNFAFALAEMEVLSGEKNVARGCIVSALDSTDSNAWSRGRLVDGDQVSHPASGADALPAPRMRHEFDVALGVRRATMYITALGLYDLRINGKRVGDHVLAPEWTDYTQRVQYQCYDVTQMIRAGKNAIAVQLGDGWYAGRIGMSDGLIGKRRGVYGRVPELLAQLEIEQTDGHVQRVITDQEWRSSLAGPIRSADILDGETHDGHNVQPGWDMPGFEARGWTAAVADPDRRVALVAQPNEPIRVVQELHPVAVTEPKPGVYVFDLGQNMVGRAHLRLRAKAGTMVTLRHAEALNDDGTIYTENLRGAPQIDHYIARGTGNEVFEPLFTYHGFRYVEVTGLSHKPEMGDLVGRVFCSSSPVVGTFECSEPLLNRLWANIFWTQRANLMSVPTDCPQRDERLGWMGDIQAYAQTGMYVMDLGGFFTKWLQDVRDAQADDGRFGDFSPHPYSRNIQFTGVPAWGDAGTFVPWQAYLSYGDKRMLSLQLDAARRWADWIRSKNPDLIWNNARGNDYNDWLNGDTLIQAGWPTQGGTVPNALFATAFFARSTQLVADMAGVLGRQELHTKYVDLAGDIRSAFCRRFVGADGTLEGDTQAGYALALAFDLLPEPQRPKAFEKMLAAIERYNHHISTGIQSTHRMMLELTRRGRTDEAYRLMMNRDFPSWLYSVVNGSTTIWERWDGYVKGRGFQNPGMNSLNHWALGSVGEWMFRVIGGISGDSATPGYRRVLLRPIPGGGLGWAKASYRSIRGTISVSWRRDSGAFSVDVIVPPGVEAEVFVPAKDAEGVTEGGVPAVSAPGVTSEGMRDGGAVFVVGGGAYRFRAAR